jgi:Ca2+-binding RTX toxin-like protein
LPRTRHSWAVTEKPTRFEFECLTGSAFGDRLFGDNDFNLLSGLKGTDEIDGGGGDDLLVGGKGGDVLTGGFGGDVFDFNKVSESRAGRVGAADAIADFEGPDVIDLQEIDADTGSGGNQAFRFIGPDAFSGTAGELRFEVSGILTQVLGDVDGNGKADLEITLHAQIAGAVGDWVL